MELDEASSSEERSERSPPGGGGCLLTGKVNVTVGEVLEDLLEL